MRGQTILVLVLALVFGGAAAVGVAVYGRGERVAKTTQGTIVIAKANVPRGMVLTDESVVIKEYPKDLIPEGVLTKLDEAIGRAAITPLFKDEPLLEAKLAPKGAGRGLASILKNGMRAVTIPTPTVASNVAGFLEAGSHVDVLWTPQETGRDDRHSNNDPPLLENVEVLAVDDKIDASTTGKPDSAPIKSVTVQLKPEEATKLAPALTRGTIHLTLRNPEDDSRAPPRAKTATIQPKKVVAVPPPPPPIPLTIRLIRGSQESSVRVVGTGSFVGTK